MTSLFKKAEDAMPVETVATETSHDYTKIKVKNLRLEMSIGVHEHELAKEQPVIVNVEVTVENNPDWHKDSINDVLNYESIVSAVKFIAKRGHINLVETFAGHIAEFCLKDPLTLDVRVQIEKPDIFDFTDSVGIEIYKSKR